MIYKFYYTAISIAVLYALTFPLFLPAQILAERNEGETTLNDTTAAAAMSAKPEVEQSFGDIPVYFEKNNGQFESKVKYFARGISGYSLFLTATEAVYVLHSPESNVQSPKYEDGLRMPTLESRLKTQDSAKAVAVYMKLAGANENSNSVGLEEMAHKTNYFKGEASNWRTGISNFRQIRMENVYDGIDTVWKGKENGGVQYDFVVEPNANPNQIEWEIEGAETVEIDGIIYAGSAVKMLLKKLPSQGIKKSVHCCENKLGLSYFLF